MRNSQESRHFCHNHSSQKLGNQVKQLVLLDQPMVIELDLV